MPACYVRAAHLYGRGDKDHYEWAGPNEQCCVLSCAMNISVFEPYDILAAFDDFGDNDCQCVPLYNAAIHRLDHAEGTAEDVEAVRELAGLLSVELLEVGA